MPLEHLPPLEHRTLALSGHEARVALRFRPGQGPVAVFLHGLGCAQDNFAPAFARKELRHRPLLTLDFPGFGHSDRPKGFPYSLAEFSRVTLALLKELGLTQAHLVGHSMGGAVAVIAARELGAALASLVNVEGNLVAADCGLSREIARLSAETFRTLLFPSLATRLGERERPYFALELAHWRAGYESARSLVTWTDQGSLLTDFLELPRPRLYVYGEESRKAEPLERLRGRVDAARVSRAGHFPMLDNPGGFYGLLAAFLDRLESQGSSGR